MSATYNSTKEIPFKFVRECFVGGVSCAIVSALVNPMDVVKVRMQIQKNVLMKGEGALYLGFSHGLSKIFTEEGIKGLFLPGMVVTMYRELIYSSLRFALYTSMKEGILRFQPDKVFNFTEMFFLGLLSGGIGSALANPTDLVRIRLQADCGKIGPSGTFITGFYKGKVPLYHGTWHCFNSIWKEGGIRAIYSGTVPTTIRSAMLTGAQLAAYEKSKRFLKDRNIEETPLVHVGCSIVAGLASTTASAPADIVKTRIMAPNHPYKGPLDCLVKTVVHEGPQALLKGWLPSFLRLGPHYILSLPLLEQLRRLVGLGYM